MNRIEICKKIIQSIKEYINTPEKLEAHRLKNHFVRSRKLSMLQIIIYLFYSSKASMYSNIVNIMEDLPSFDFPNVTKQAISKARQFISADLFKELFYLSVDRFYSSIRKRKDWHGYHLFAVDGSRIELPNSPSNFKFFGKMYTIKDSEGHKKYYTQGLASIIYDVLEDYIVHASLHPYLTSEREAAKIHLDNLEALNIYDNNVIIFDRGYYSKQLFAHLVNHGHFCVMRLNETIKLTRKAREKGDLITTINVGTTKEPIEIKARVIVVTLPDESLEFLATNIFDESINNEMFRELYFCRWPIEVKYKELKTMFQLEEFNGATKTSIFQEFYINLLLSNLTSLIKNQADDEIEVKRNPNAKYRYQANRSFIINQTKRSFCKILIGHLEIKVVDEIFQLALKAKSQLQPGRSQPRYNRIRHRRTHFRNKKTSI